MLKKSQTFLFVVLMTLIVAPSTGRAITFGLGLGGGGTFPLSKYIKAAPDNSGSSDRTLTSVKNGPGWSLHAELLLIGMEIRYTWQVFTWKEIKYTDSSGATQSASTKGLPWLQFHSLTLGYRWYVVNSAFKLYFPIGGGAAFVTFNDIGKLKGQYGATLYAGLVMEYEVVKHFSIGLGARYNFFITNQPTDLVKGKIEKNVENDLYSGKVPSVHVGVKDVVAMFHSITANLSFTVTF